MIRIHRSIMSSTMPQFTFQFGCFEDQNNSHSSVLASTSNVLSSNIMHSWVYPQSTLPPSLISVLTSSAAEGGVSNKFVYLMLGETPPPPLSSQKKTPLMLSFVFCSGNGFLKKTTACMGRLLSESLLHATELCL
jgi:hypothetical protein